MAKTCSRCGIIKDLGEFSKDRNNLKDGLRRSCKSCDNTYYAEHKEYKKLYRERTKEHSSEVKKIYYKSPKGRYSTYKTSAKTRGYEFNLTLEEFLEYWDAPCFYCGEDTEGIGLDRMNNEIGYEVDNVVSCCTDCNIMKKAKSTEDFINKCKQITENMGEI